MKNLFQSTSCGNLAKFLFQHTPKKLPSTTEIVDQNLLDENKKTVQRNMEKLSLKYELKDFADVLKKIEESIDENIRFEHLILEIALLYIYEKIQRRFEDLERTADQVMAKLKEKKLHDQIFEQLLHLKNL